MLEEEQKGNNIEIQALLDEGFDAMECVDIVEHNLRKNQFDNFWAAVDELLNEKYAIPDERRHGTSTYIAPLFVSLRHFLEVAQDRMAKMFPESHENRVPSLEYFRFVVLFK